MPKISLSGPAELLTVIPFHLGFQPRSSVVVVGFHGKRLGLLARLDVVPPEVAAEAAAQTVPTLLQDDPSSVALVAFEEEADEAMPLLEALADAMEWDRVLVRERLVVRDGRWRSVGCDCCPDEGRLLPAQADVAAVADYVALGHAVLPDREGLARLVAPLSPGDPRHRGMSRAVDDWQRRYAAAGGRLLDRPDTSRPRRSGGGRGLTLLQGGDPGDRRLLVDESLTAWAAVLHGAADAADLHDLLPALVGPLRDVQVRDALVGWLCPGSVPLQGFPEELLLLLAELLGPGLRLPSAAGDDDPLVDAWPGDLGDEPDEAFEARARLDRLDALDGADDVEDLEAAAALEGWDEAVASRLVLSRLEQVCRATPGAHAAPVLSVLASLAWWVGDGARAGVAVDQALELEPEHRLSLLVRQSLDHGIRPRRCA
ncbi:DUF4192 domain-containing protein [Terrabacter sp. NPDC080008]|uniref:DUF4192 domain-containing protein n=1 Tax=Terrabacter sp. NPDC080008 TaxID=3155176 RepID=UPI00344FAE86